MAKYKIQVKKSAAKELGKIPKKDLVKILDKIEDLSINPHPTGSIKLTNQERYREYALASIGCCTVSKILF